VKQGYIARPLDGNHGAKHPKGDDYVPEGVPFIMAQDLKDKKVDFNSCHFITEKQASTLKKGWAKTGDVLLTNKGTIGRVAIVQESEYEDMLLTPQITYYRCLRDIDNEYLAGYFITDFFVNQLEKLTTGTTRASVTITQQENLELIIPPVGMQREFVKVVEQSDKSKFIGFKSQFIELFGKLPEEFKHDTVKLGDIADMLSGGTPSSKHPEYYGDAYPFVTTPCLGKNYIDSSDAVNWLSEIGVEKSSTHVIPAYSIMYGSRVGVGKSSINTCEMCTNQDILSFFNIDTSKYDLLFIKKVMDQYFDYIDTQKRGSTIKGVPSDLVKGIKIPVVAIEEQKAFAAFTEQSDKSK